MGWDSKGDPSFRGASAHSTGPMYQASRPDFGVAPSWEPGESAFLLLALKTVTFKTFEQTFPEIT